MEQAARAQPRVRRLTFAPAWVRPRRLLLIGDVLTLCLAVVFVPALVASHFLPTSALHLSFAVFSIVCAGSLILLMLVGGQYSPNQRVSRLYDNVALIKNALIAWALALGFMWVAEGFPGGVSARALGAIALHTTALLCSMMLVRWAVWSHQLRLFKAGRGLRNVVIAGDGSAASQFAGFLHDNWWLGIRAVGSLSVRSLPHARHADRATPVVRDVTDIRRTVAAVDAGEVIVALDRDEQSDFPKLAAALAEAGIPFHIIPGLFEECFKPARVAGFRGLPVVDVAFDKRGRIEREIKRFLDQLMAIAALVVSAPFFLGIALAIKLTSRGPIFYRQTRVGINGYTFSMVKFRTMVTDADQRLEDLMSCNEADGCLFKMRDDPRVTAVGRWLRKHSLDELPQFWNVLRGEMSVVGPRPPLPWEVDLYETAHLRRLCARPGITGVWQVSGRSDRSFEDMVSMDCRYIRNWSLGLDLSILFKTVRVVLTGQGAY